MEGLILRSFWFFSLVMLLFAKESPKTCQNTRIVMDFLINDGLPASLEDIYKDFKTVAGTSCQLEQTCCSHKLEEALHKSTGQIYTSKIRNALDSALSPCKQQSIIRETTTLFESFKAQVIGDLKHVYRSYFDGHEGILDDLFNGFITAVQTGQAADVESLYGKTFFEIYLASYLAFPGIRPLPNTKGARDCFYRYYIETEGSRVEQWRNAFMPSFRNLMYYMRGLHAMDKFIHRLTQHSLSEQCKASLMKMDKCSACAGYASLLSCKGLCLNLLRGCLVDLSDLEEPLLALTQVLQEINDQNMKDNIISKLIGLEQSIFELTGATSLNAYSISTKVSSCYSMRRKRSVDSESHEGEVRVKRQSHIVPRSQVEFPFEVFNESTTCVKNQIAALLTLPETLCGASASRDNQNCWNGHLYDSYSRKVVAFQRATQKNNPEVLYCPNPSQYQYEINILKYVTRELASVSGKCSQDDEDCGTIAKITNYYQFPAASSFKSVVISLDDEGALEGSGSGSGVDEPVFACEPPSASVEVSEEPDLDVDKDMIIQESGSIPLYLSSALTLMTVSLTSILVAFWL